MTTMPLMVDVKSSNLEAIGHNQHGLFVRFKGGGVYCYPGCPQSVYLEGLHHKSPGTWLKETVKPKYKHRKL